MKNIPVINEKKISKYLSLILRHKPETLGIVLDKNGWTSVQILLQKMKASGKEINIEQLKAIVENNAKKRFAFNEDQTKIRANQGHSIAIELGYQATTPPSILFHGTATRNLKSIFDMGLTKRSRHHVHLSTNLETAKEVGQRYGKVVVLQIAAESMQSKGFQFFKSDNGVWLTDHVPTEFWRFMSQSLVNKYS